MKIRTLSLLSLAGMTLTAVTVYSLTPRFASATPEPERRLIIDEDAVKPPVKVTGAAAAAAEDGHFKIGNTLVVEGTLGNKELLKGARGETFLLVEVTGGPGKATTRAPVNLAIVIDRSGSMRGSRLANAISAARAAVDRLHDGDVVSVLAFDTATKIIVPPTTVDPGSRSSVGSAIGSISLGGDTCISCGLEDGMTQLERTTGKVSRMIVLSDGDATAGVRDVPGFRSIAQRASQRGIAITTVGVNLDYNERILGAIAQESNGQHYFVENETALARAFEDEAEALTATVASNVEATIDLGPGVELDRVYDRSFKKQEGRVVVPLGAFSRAETKTILLKVRATPEAERAPIAKISVAYRDLTSDADARADGELAAKGVATAAEVGPVDPVVESRVQRSETTAALEDANRLARENKLDEARKRLEQQADRVRASAQKKHAVTTRQGDIDADSKRQEEALDKVKSRFSAPANPFEAKGGVRDGQKFSSDLSK